MKYKHIVKDKIGLLVKIFDTRLHEKFNNRTQYLYMWTEEMVYELTSATK